jgi:hypothetical protein
LIQAVRAAALFIAAAWLVSPACAAQVIVARRGWHIDVGFALSDLYSPLRSVAADTPSARYLFFGFGDMRYLMAKHHGSSTLAAALWPGRGIMLVTALDNTPQQGFGAQQVVELDLSADDTQALQEFIWNSFITQEGGLSVYRPGPYEGSLYFLAKPAYSALHTCNTWAAEALKAGRLGVHSRGILFARQLWSQVRRLQRAQPPGPSLAPTP